MDGVFLLDVVIGEGAAILELLACKDEALLVWWDALLVLHLALDSLDRVGAFDFQGDSLTSQGLDKDLHLLVWLGCVCVCGRNDINMGWGFLLEIWFRQSFWFRELKPIPGHMVPHSLDRPRPMPRK
jgi:hypothetical protein